MPILIILIILIVIIVILRKNKDSDFMKKVNEINEKNKQRTQIVQTMIIDNDSRKKLGSVVGRGAVGAMIHPVGILAAASAKNKKTTTFLIEYQDGHKETKVVKNNSNEYKELCKYLKIN